MNKFSHPHPEAARNRFYLTLLWALITLGSSYLLLLVSVLLFGLKDFIHPPEDLTTIIQIIITLYTLIPAFIAILFMVRFNSAHFLEPGLNLPKNKTWLLFGLLYAFLVLTPTIITSSIISDVTYNFNFRPLGDLNFTLNNAILDVVIYVIIVPFILVFSLGGFIRIIGEEYGWRGYLLPELIKSRNYLKISYGLLLAGLIWTIYHIPFFTILSPQNLEISEMILSLLGSFGVFFGATFALAWAYLKTHNLWPALSLHYLWNIINPQITGNIYDNSKGLFDGTLWLINGEGLIGGFFHLIIGFFFLYLIIKDKDKLLEDHDRYLREFNEKYYPSASTTSKKDKEKKRTQKSKRRNWEKQIPR